MRRSRSRQPRRESEQRGGRNSRSPAPELPYEPFFSAIQAEQAELAIKAGVHLEKSLQFYFLDEKHKAISDEIRHAIIANEIRRIFKENRRSDKNIINMIRNLCQEKGVNVETDQKWMKHTVMKIPMVIDANIQLTKDRGNYEDFFKRMILKDLKMEPNQNLSEYVQSLKLKFNDDLVLVMGEMIKGRIVIHRDENMVFPDKDPIIIEGEGLTHHIICERNEQEVVPHKVTFIRREMYGMLGDLYGLTDSQKKEISIVAVSYKEYFQKLDAVEGRQAQRLKQVQIQIEDDNSEWLWEELRRQYDKQKQEKLEEELKLQAQIAQRQTQAQTVQQEVTVIPQSEPKLSSRQHIKPTQEQQQGNIKQSAENINDISIQEAELDSSNRLYVLAENTDRDEDQQINALRVTIPGNKRRVAHLQYYLKKGDDYKLQGRTRNQVIIVVQQFNQQNDFGIFKYKTTHGLIEIYNMFIWKYADRYVDFSYYMMSMQRTSSWWFIVDHYASIWLARSRGVWNQLKVNDDIKQFMTLNINQLQQLYDTYVESQLVSLCASQANSGQVQLVTQYQWEQSVYAIKRNDGEEMLMENDAFFEHSNFTIVYARNRTSKARQIKSLSYKIRYMKEHNGKLFTVNGDVHSVISTLIKFNILVPGVTPLTAYKWGSFNVNIFTSSLSASMESVLSCNASAYERVTPQEQKKNWVQLYINLTKEEQKKK